MTNIIELKNGEKLELQGYVAYIRCDQEPHKFSYRNENGELITVRVRSHRYGHFLTLEDAEKEKEKWNEITSREGYEAEEVTIREYYDWFYEDEE